MKMLVESLKRMYKKGTLTEEQIAERVTKGSIYLHSCGDYSVCESGC